MAAPSLPTFFNMRCTDKGESLSGEFYLYLDQQFQVLNNTITIYGVTVPSFTAVQISEFPNNINLGTIWYNSTSDELQFQGASGIQTITSTY